jgi:hypothetical protein
VKKVLAQEGKVTNLRQSRRLDFVNRSKRLKLVPLKGGKG